MKTQDRLKEINITFNSIIEEILVNKENDVYKIGTFNTKDLEETNIKGYSPNIDMKFKYFFEKLDIIDKNAIYIFEMESEDKGKEIVRLLSDYSKTKNRKTVPPINKGVTSRILYIGVRKGHKNKIGLTNIVGRINQHFGYYEVPTTQGLQLAHYAKGKDFEITLHVVIFEDMENAVYLNLLEKLISYKLKPLCGRH